jgi:hypothetical protein
MDRLDETIRVAMDTDDASRLMVLSWLLASTASDEPRKLDRAIELSHRACELTAYKDVKAVDTLAAVYAIAGDYDSAVKWSEQSIRLLDDESDPQVRERMLKALTNYRAKSPLT